MRGLRARLERLESRLGRAEETVLTPEEEAALVSADSASTALQMSALLKALRRWGLERLVLASYGVAP